MENEETKVGVVDAPAEVEEAKEAVAPVPSGDSKDRLAAARAFAVTQYEKIRRAAVEQFDHVRKYTNDAREQLNVRWNATCSKTKELHNAGEEFVKAHPTGSIFGALGVGVIIGLMLGGSRR